MADVSTVPAVDAGIHPAHVGRWERARLGVAGYLMIARMWVRASLAYRTSFVLLSCSQVVVTGMDFLVILILFSHTDALGGLGPTEVFFIYGTSGVALGIADMCAGSLEAVGQRIRDGSLDSMLVRPIPVLAQVAADQFAIRRIGRITQALTVLVLAVIVAPVDWNAAKVVLVVVMVVSGTGIFCAVYLLGGCFQFVAGDAAEVSNAFTYGGDALAQLPWTIYPKELVQAVVFIVPLAFINWVPVAWILGRPLPLGLPWFVAWCSPLVAAAFLGVAGLLWRLAVRSYRSTGS